MRITTLFVYFAIGSTSSTDQILEQREFYKRYLSSESYLAKAQSQLLSPDNLVELLESFHPVPPEVVAAIKGEEKTLSLPAPIEDPEIPFPSRSLTIFGAKPDSSSSYLPKSIANHANRNELEMIKAAFMIYADAQGDEFLDSAVIPLYVFLCKVKVSGAAEENPQMFFESWTELLSQVHYGSVLLAFRPDDEPAVKNLRVVSELILTDLIDILAFSAITHQGTELHPVDIIGPITVGGVTIPEAVVDEGIQTAWCFLAACLRYLRGTTTTTPEPTIDPSLGLKRKQEISHYLALVNAAIEQINAQLQKVKDAKLSSDDANVIASVDVLHGLVMDQFTGIVSAALLNELFKVDLKSIQLRFFDMANSLAPFDIQNYETVISGVTATTKLLRMELLEAAVRAN